jgi:S1-C subfamily serine protease
MMKILVAILTVGIYFSCNDAQTIQASNIKASMNDEKSFLEVEKKTISIYKDVVPTVVNVTNIKVARSFFYGKAEAVQGSGTGFVWDKAGHIVTNFHVVQGGNSFVITFQNDKKQYKAEVVGTSPRNDIAVLKLTEKPKKELKTIKVGTSHDIQVGQMTIAIGNPFGLDHSISKGIVSATGRKIKGIAGTSITNMIQTDAAINQGNSGGPLLNSLGQLIGMNTMIFSTSGSSAGLGFAVPVDTISRIVPQLIKHGKVIRPGLGIGVMSEDMREMYVGEKGVAITYIDEDGAAYKAGLRGMSKDRYGRIYIGDVILEVNGASVNSLDDITTELEKYKIGDTIKVTYLREDKTKTIQVVLEALDN